MPCPAVTRRGRAAAALLAALAGCAGGPPAYEPGRLDQERIERCREAERAYRAEAPEYPALRDGLAGDPVAVHWLVRMFVRDLILVREGRPLGEEEELFRAAARIENPVEARATAEIETLGVRAVPTLVSDLLRNSQPQPRQLGVELIGRIGAPAVPALTELAKSSVARERRAAARALGAIEGSPVATQELIRLAGDAEFTVRADALRGLARGGDPAAALLVDSLARDEDPFVRRVAAQTLLHHRGTAVAGALVDYLARCQREGDFAGEQAAQASLAAQAGTRGPRTLAAWRSWLEAAR